MISAFDSDHAVPAQESTPDVVLRVATELFAEHGYHGVGMRAIADAAGLRPASVYHHYPSKVALLEAVARRATSGFIVEAIDALEADGPPSARLDAVLRRHIAYFHRHVLDETVTRRDMGALPTDTLLDVQASRRSYHEAVTAVIAEGCSTGEFTVDDPSLAAFAVLDAINGINVWFRNDGTSTLDDVADAYMTMMSCGVLGGRALGENERA